MPAETLEPPAQSANDVFHSVESFDTPNPKAVQPEKPATEATSDTSSTPNPDTSTGTQELIDKPDAMKDAPVKPGEKKSALEKIGKVAKPEAAKAPDKDANGKTVEEKPVDAGNTRQLREAYEKQKADMAALRAELDKVRPDAEKLVELRAELDGSREELAKLKALNLNDEERKEYGSLREMHALDVLRSSPEFEKNYLAPARMQVAKIESAAKQANLSADATESLKNAMDIQDEFARDTEIERILTAAELAPNIHNRFLNAMSAVGRELQEKLYPAMEAKEREAFNIQQAARLREKQQGEQKSTAEKAEYLKEYGEVRKMLTEETLRPLMEDTELSVEGTTLAEAIENAEPATTPREKAAQAQVFAAAPFMVMKINKLLQKVHELEQGNKIRNGASPSRADALVKTPNNQHAPLDANTVFKSVSTFER